jgi:hypothetical protein
VNADTRTALEKLIERCAPGESQQTGEKLFQNAPIPDEEAHVN